MTPGRRDLLALAVAIAGGLALLYVDSRPGFDDTGITAVGLVTVAAVAAFVSGRRPWLWAIGVGIWIPLFERSGSDNSAPLLPLAFAAIGAALGYGLARLSRRGP